MIILCEQNQCGLKEVYAVSSRTNKLEKNNDNNILDREFHLKSFPQLPPNNMDHHIHNNLPMSSITTIHSNRIRLYFKRTIMNVNASIRNPTAYVNVLFDMSGNTPDTRFYLYTSINDIITTQTLMTDSQCI